MTIPFDTLNPSQLAAVQHDAGHALIIAGPGTGKTHTLMRRIAHLAKSMQSPNKILAITFTKKSAAEMQERLERLDRRAFERSFVGTFHSFCLDVLKTHSAQAQIPVDFTVAEIEEVETLAKDLWPAQTKSQQKKVLEEISRFKSRVWPNDAEIPVNVFKYNQALRSRKKLDFDDLLLETIGLFERSPDVLKIMRDQYRYICVDEYQDINPVQHRLLTLLVRDGVQITAIGDPNQAIYGFRGSDVGFFERFTKDFEGAKTLHLSENYRSAANLLTACGQVMEKTTLFAQGLDLTAKLHLEGRLIIHAASTENAEAEYVVHRIEQLVGGTSMFSQDSGRVATHTQASRGFSDIAVLYRMNSQAAALKKALERSGIPYQVSGDVPAYQWPADEGVDRKVEKVSLLTLHAAKGLEFPVVLILGCEENILPLQLEGLSTNLEEERRLFYVGMTRAKEELYLLRAHRRFLFGERFENPQSRFLADIEENLKHYELAKSLPKKKSSTDDSQLTLF